MTVEYKVAVIGCTGRGDYGHDLDIAWFDIPNASVVAVADEDRDGLAAAVERLNLTSGYSDYRKMLDVEKPDIVTICSRWVDRHHEMACEAIRRGIHIYMEKPFCRTPAEADEIIALCERHNVKCIVSHPTRFSPLIATIRDLIDQGAIGRVLEFRGRGKEDMRDGRDRSGAEDLWVLGTHVLDMVQALGGAPIWCFANVLTDGRPATDADAREGAEGTGQIIGNTINAMFGMPDQAIAHFSSRQGAGVGHEPSRYGLQIFGSRGIIELIEGTIPSVKYLGDPSWSPGRSGAEWQDVSSAGIGIPEPLVSPKYKARHWLAIDELLSAIEEDRDPVGSPKEARIVTDMIFAVFESHRRRAPVDLPLRHDDRMQDQQVYSQESSR